MKELTFEKKKLKINFEGNDLVVNFPSFLQLKKFAKDAQDIGDYEATTILFTEIGIKKEILDQLDIDQVNEILETITPQSKKK